MKKVISLFLCLTCALLPLLTFSSCSVDAPEKFKVYYFDYFDTATTIVGYAKNQQEFDAVCEIIKGELEFYHKQYTIYNSYDGINNICALNKTVNGAHKELRVDRCIIDLLLFCKQLYTQTDGQLNVAMGSVLSIWHSYRNEGMDDPAKAQLPPMDRLKEASLHTDIEKIIIDEEKQTVFISDPNVKLDVGAVAKGYAVERVAQTLIGEGITGYVLNVGGNVRTIGSGNGTPWQVGIENPDTDSEQAYIELLQLEDKSLVTSGNYQRFYVVDGKNYHHIIDPETLMPGEKFLSVSVITTDSGYADGLSTTLFLKDFRDGMELIEATEDTEAMWVFPDGTRKYSSGFKAFCQ
jgi:thiamine biosynthesis lipoprotein